MAIDLLRMGYQVYRSVTTTSAHDLEIEIGGRLIRVQVKTGHLAEKNIIVSDSRQSKCDIIAVALNGMGHVMYIPDPKTWAERDWAGASPPLGVGQRIVSCDSYLDERRIIAANILDGFLHVEFKDGSSLKMSLNRYAELSNAMLDDLNICVPVYGGRALRWPRLKQLEITGDELFRGR